MFSTLSNVFAEIHVKGWGGWCHICFITLKKDSLLQQDNKCLPKLERVFQNPHSCCWKCFLVSKNLRRDLIHQTIQISNSQSASLWQGFLMASMKKQSSSNISECYRKNGTVMIWLQRSHKESLESNCCWWRCNRCPTCVSQTSGRIWDFNNAVNFDFRSNVFTCLRARHSGSTFIQPLCIHTKRPHVQPDPQTSSSALPQISAVNLS